MSFNLRKRCRMTCMIVVIRGWDTWPACNVSCCLCRTHLNWVIVSMMMRSLHFHGTFRHVNCWIIHWIIGVDRVIVAIEVMWVGSWLWRGLIESRMSLGSSSWRRHDRSIAWVRRHISSFGGWLNITKVTCVLGVFWTEHVQHFREALAYLYLKLYKIRFGLTLAILSAGSRLGILFHAWNSAGTPCILIKPLSQAAQDHPPRGFFAKRLSSPSGLWKLKNILARLRI